MSLYLVPATPKDSAKIKPYICDDGEVMNKHS